MTPEEVQKLNDLEEGVRPFSTFSGYSRCPHCLTFGVPFPKDRVCGDCLKPDLVKLHEEKAILKYLESIGVII